MCKEWTRSTKEKEPRQLISMLNVERQNAVGPRRQEQMYKQNPTRMAELARSYHDSIQSVDLDLLADAERKNKIREALAHISASLTQEQYEDLDAMTP